MSHLYAKNGGSWGPYNAQVVYKKENGAWKKVSWGDVGTDSREFAYVPDSRKTINYVSLGDSIAAGHTINSSWPGEGTQYGVDGNTSTQIVELSYTDLIRDELCSIYGDANVHSVSFARSGDTVADLMSKLSHAAVISAIQKADLVSICIGANDVLEPAMSKLEDYIDTGDLTELENHIKKNLKILNTDSEVTSYNSLFRTLENINPNAKYIFTTVYNPYKYLYIEGPDSNGNGGFFGPLLSTTNGLVIDLEAFFGYDIPLIDIPKYDLGEIIRGAFYDMAIVKTLFSRVNGLGEWTEKCLETGLYIEETNEILSLNKVLKAKIAESANPNFTVVDSKMIFDLFPDNTSSSSDVDYGDLVSVEYTRNYDTAKMDWGKLWPNSSALDFWLGLAKKHLEFKTSAPWVDFRIDDFFTELVTLIVEKVIVPDVDPHPEPQGHAVLKRSFTNSLGLIKYNAGSGSYVHGDIVLKSGNLPYVQSVISGQEFYGWCSDDGLTTLVNPGSEFSDYKAESDHTLADLVSGSSIISKTPKTTTLYAKWR